MAIGRLLATVLIILVAVAGANSAASAKDRHASVRKIIAFGVDWRGRQVPTQIRTASRRGYLIRSRASRLILGIGF